MFWVAWMILEAWNVEFEKAHFLQCALRKNQIIQGDWTFLGENNRTTEKTKSFQTLQKTGI